MPSGETCKGDWPKRTRESAVGVAVPDAVEQRVGDGEGGRHDGGEANSVRGDEARKAAMDSTENADSREENDHELEAKLRNKESRRRGERRGAMATSGRVSGTQVGSNRLPKRTTSTEESVEPSKPCQ